jgi:hypothetical protein
MKWQVTFKPGDQELVDTTDWNGTKLKPRRLGVYRAAVLRGGTKRMTMSDIAVRFCSNTGLEGIPSCEEETEP